VESQSPSSRRVEKNAIPSSRSPTNFPFHPFPSPVILRSFRLRTLWHRHLRIASSSGHRAHYTCPRCHYRYSLLYPFHLITPTRRNRPYAHTHTPAMPLMRSEVKLDTLLSPIISFLEHFSATEVERSFCLNVFLCLCIPPCLHIGWRSGSTSFSVTIFWSIYFVPYILGSHFAYVAFLQYRWI